MTGIDQPKPRKPYRNEDYLRFVRSRACCMCSQDRTDQLAVVPHHFGSRGVGQKCDDYLTVPVCIGCHRMIHDGQLGGPKELREQFMAVAAETLAEYIEERRGKGLR